MARLEEITIGAIVTGLAGSMPVRVLRSSGMELKPSQLLTKTMREMLPSRYYIGKMKKTILARAFRGELGTNNPNEESALGLLREVLSGDLNTEV